MSVVDNIREMSKEEAEIYIKNSELNINRKEIPIGKVVFFIKKNGYKWSVAFGTIEEHYTSEICVQLYEFADRRLINGIPVDEFETPTKWQKLPKGWSYDTELFTLSHEEMPETAKKLHINVPEDIIKAINEGILVKVQSVDHCHFDTEIDSKKGWRIVRKYPMFDHHPSYVSLMPCEVFRTFEEAEKVIALHEAEFERQANLSDLDWSIEQIDKDIDRWASMYAISADEKSRCRERIMSIDNLEDVETRIFSGSIQWKYSKNKRWMNIEY